MTNATGSMAERVLRELMGYSSFRPYQETCVHRLLEGCDVLAVLPTGGGKSAIYQIPALTLHREDARRRCLVVSPLLSLIDDQMAALNRRFRVDAAGELARADGAGRRGQLAAAARLGDGSAAAAAAPFVFTTPEQLKAAGALVARLPLCLIAVDEAHCISSHGRAFREDYRALGELRRLHPAVPICALTATASSEVSRDVVSLLGLRAGHAVVRAPVDRPNLRLAVALRRGLQQDAPELAARLLGAAAGAAAAAAAAGQQAAPQGIVYFQTRAEVERGAEALRQQGVDVEAYHAGLEPPRRREVQERFVAGRLRCIAATVAFGMGVDVPGVRCVVHYGLPSSLESYAQEIGRAGRDGAAADCVLYWASGDASARGRGGRQSLDPELAGQGLREVLAFVQTSGCLRRHLAAHFEDEDGASSCAARGGEACGHCREGRGGAARPQLFVDYGARARSLLATVQLVRAGATKQLDYHCGRHTKEVDELRARLAGARHGAGRDGDPAFWKALHRALQAHGLLECNQYGACLLSAAGRAALEGEEPIVLPELPELPAPPPPPGGERKRPRGGCGGGGREDTPLRIELGRWRHAEAAARGCPAFAILGDRALDGIAAAEPADAKALLAVSGVGQAKLAAFGARLLELVRVHGEREESVRQAADRS